MNLDALDRWIADRFNDSALTHPEPSLAECGDAAAKVRELGRYCARLGMTPLVERCRVGAFVAPHAFRAILSDAVRSVRDATDAERMVSAAAPRRDWYSVAGVAVLISRDPAAVREDIRAGALAAQKAPGTSYYRIVADDARAYVEAWRQGGLEDRSRKRDGRK